MMISSGMEWWIKQHISVGASVEATSIAVWEKKLERSWREAGEKLEVKGGVKQDISVRASVGKSPLSLA